MTEKQLELIRKARNEISALEITQDSIFNALLSELALSEDVATDTDAKDWLFDAVYNTANDDESFDKHIEALSNLLENKN